MAGEKETKVEEKVAEAPAATATEAPKKKSNTALIVVIVLLVIFIGLPALGFGAFWFLVGSKIHNTVTGIENGKVSINTSQGTVNVNTNTGQSWPTSAPSVVPKLSAGKITGSVKLGDAWTITATNVTDNDFTKYENDLAAAGFTMDQESNINGLRTISGTKDGWRVSATYTPSDSSSANAILIGIAKAD